MFSCECLTQYGGDQAPTCHVPAPASDDGCDFDPIPDEAITWLTAGLTGRPIDEVHRECELAAGPATWHLFMDMDALQSIAACSHRCLDVFGALAEIGAPLAALSGARIVDAQLNAQLTETQVLQR